jgi:2-hydroxy-6-oxonona-2,4-dienedioate hydrolase
MTFQTGDAEVDATLNRALAASHALDVADGIGTLHLRHWPGPIGAERLLLFHGGSGSWLHWIKNVEVLSGQYDVWTLDLPALGWSTDQDKPYEVSLAVERILSVMKAQPALQSVHLVAFSWGCVAASLIATRKKDWVKSIFLVGPASLGVRKRPAERLPLIRRHRGMSREEVLSAQRQNLELLMISRPERVDACAVHIQDINHQMARFNSAQYYASTLVIDQIGHIDRPLSVIYGDQDAPALPDIEGIGQEMRMQNPAMRFVIVPDCGHWLQYEQPEVFHRYLSLHLSSTDTAAGTF